MKPSFTQGLVGLVLCLVTSTARGVNSPFTQKMENYKRGEKAVYLKFRPCSLIKNKNPQLDKDGGIYHLRLPKNKQTCLVNYSKEKGFHCVARDYEETDWTEGSMKIYFSKKAGHYFPTFKENHDKVVKNKKFSDGVFQNQVVMVEPENKDVVIKKQPGRGKWKLFSLTSRSHNKNICLKKGDKHYAGGLIHLQLSLHHAKETKSGRKWLTERLASSDKVIQVMGSPTVGNPIVYTVHTPGGGGGEASLEIEESPSYKWKGKAMKISLVTPNKHDRYSRYRVGVASGSSWKDKDNKDAVAFFIPGNFVRFVHSKFNGRFIETKTNEGKSTEGAAHKAVFFTFETLQSVYDEADPEKYQDYNPDRVNLPFSIPEIPKPSD